MMNRDRLSLKGMLIGIAIFFGAAILCSLLYYGLIAGVIAFVVKTVLGN